MSKCVMRVENHRLAERYTKVKLLPEVYQRLVTICSVTGKTLQDATDELLTFAMDNTEIYNGDTKINIEI